MADQKLSALPSSAALDGTELMSTVQSGSNTTSTPAQVRDFVGANLVIPELSSDPVAPTDGDIWMRDDAGTKTIRWRQTGVTYAVEVTAI